MKNYSHKKSNTDIATALNRSKSTIQRDVIKQGRDSYKAMNAEWLAEKFLSHKKSYADIASALHRSKSTIQRDGSGAFGCRQIKQQKERQEQNKAV